MQHQSNSWYIPWNMQLQMQQQRANAAAGAIATYPAATASAVTPLSASTNALTCKVLPAHFAQHLTPEQIQSTAHYYGHILHPGAVPSTTNMRLPIGMYQQHQFGGGGGGNVTQKSLATLNGCPEQSFNITATMSPDNGYNQQQNPTATGATKTHPLSHLPSALMPASAASATFFSPLPLHNFATCSPNMSSHNDVMKSYVESLYKMKSIPLEQQQQQQQITNTIAKLAQPPVPPCLSINANTVALHSSANPPARSISLSNGEPILSKKISEYPSSERDSTLPSAGKRKAAENDTVKDLKKAKLETKALKAKRPGFSDDRYNETSYYYENGLRKVYPYYFTFTTFTKGRWVGEQILDVFSKEFRAHPAAEYERCINAGTLTVNYEKVPTDYRLKHNDLLANIVHRHEVPVTSQTIKIVHIDEDIVVVNKPASIPVHPCGRYRHNTVVFILAKEYNLKNLRTIHRLDRLTSGLLLFGRTPKKARQMEHQIRNREVEKEYVCRVEGNFPEGVIECKEPIEVVSYKIGVCKVSPTGKDCKTTFERISFNGHSSVVRCKPLTGRMHQIRVHLQFLGFPVINDPLYNHDVFGPLKGCGGNIGKTDAELVRDLINIHNAENWLGIDENSMSLFQTAGELDDISAGPYNLTRTPSNDSTNEVAKIADNVSESKETSTETPTNDLPEPEASSSKEGTPDRKMTISTQTGHDSPDNTYNPVKNSFDKHCYECKVRYRDPKPRDLVMYLHAWKYKGPGWEYETELPSWASSDWKEVVDTK